MPTDLPLLGQQLWDKVTVLAGFKPLPLPTPMQCKDLGEPSYQPSNPAATARPTLGSPDGHQNSKSSLRNPVVPSPAISLPSPTAKAPYDLEAMDTTPPSHSILFHSPPVLKINCSPSDRATHGPRNPQSSDSTHWIQALATSHTHAVQGSAGSSYQPSNPAATARPTLGSPHGHQHASSSTLQSPVVPSPAITLPNGTVNPPSYSEAMHITPLSQCIIVHPPPSSGNSYSPPDSAPPGPRNPLPSGNTATATATSQAHAVQDPWTTSYQPSDPAATNHPTLGTSGGHQYASSSSLRSPVVPSAPVSLPSVAAQAPSDLEAMDTSP
ncbi:hypothetical protein H920_10016 [Fukomys damarensis]|uniref:Uncharacterized protein n=1 Tax=Fukomys damarensis TaxID=885580 RepID=A0A091DDK7_FUKDA|nr:hypothetical protein H920_10016 [Fukomys damarensis]